MLVPRFNRAARGGGFRGLAGWTRTAKGGTKTLGRRTNAMTKPETKPTMEQLWAPWRLAYVAAAKPPAEEGACFICEALAGDEDRRNLLVLRKRLSAVMLNR